MKMFLHTDRGRLFNTQKRFPGKRHTTDNLILGDLEARRLALPELIRQQHPWRGFVVSMIIVGAWAYFDGFVMSSARVFVVGNSGIPIGLLSGFIFKRAGRSFQPRWVRLAGLSAVLCVFIDFAKFMFTVTSDAVPYQIAIHILWIGGVVEQGLTGFHPSLLLLIVDLLLAYAFASYLGKATFQRSEIHRLANRAKQDQQEAKTSIPIEYESQFKM